MVFFMGGESMYSTLFKKLFLIELLLIGATVYGMKRNEAYTKLLDDDQATETCAKVIILNGPAYAGKKQVINKLIKTFHHVYVFSDEDAYMPKEAGRAYRELKDLPSKELAEEQLVLLCRIIEAARCANLIICDATLLNRDTYADISGTFCQALRAKGFDVALVLMYSPISTILENAQKRDVSEKAIRGGDEGYHHVLNGALQFMHFYALKAQSWISDDGAIGDCLSGKFLMAQIKNACQMMRKYAPAPTAEFFESQCDQWLAAFDDKITLEKEYNLYATIGCNRIFYNDSKHNFNNQIEELKALCY
jgi:hypothetical protein